jgi:DNA-binding NarL/FixJ family response regulator
VEACHDPLVLTRVLIVDDHASFRRLSARLLSEYGFAVVGEAATAAAALAEATRLEPDLVLLDIVLPDRSGIAVAFELSRRPHPPRVVLTSSRSRSDFGSSFDWPTGCAFMPKHELTGASLMALARLS